MIELNHSRLIQERWLSLIRWLYLEAFLFGAGLTTDLARAFDSSRGDLFAAFAIYTIIVSLLVLVRRRSWPIWLAYVTAAVDTIIAVLFLSSDPSGIVNPALIAVVAASVGVGIRRFPIFETFFYSFMIAAGIIAARIFYYQDLNFDFPVVLPIGAIAVLPVLARAATLAPQEGGRDDPMARLLSRLGPSAGALGSLQADAATSTGLYHATARMLAQYSNAQFGAILIRQADESYDLYSVVDDVAQTDHLPAQAAENLAPRLMGVTESTILTRRDNLATRGLPDQYPQRLDAALVVPLPNGSVRGALFAANRRHGGFRPDDRVFGTLLAHEMVRAILAHIVATNEIAASIAAMEALLAAIEAKRPGSREQSEECARLAVAIAQELEWEASVIEELRLASLLHDIGELAVSDTILDKPAPLEPEEFAVMREHPRVASRIIDYFNHSPLVLNAVYMHHERWDGRGYPSGLEGESIPLEARILCLADSIESMLSPKVYRPALSVTDALQEIVKASGTQFDPSVVQAFLGVLQREGPLFLERRQPLASPERLDRDRHRGG